MIEDAVYSRSSTQFRPETLSQTIDIDAIITIDNIINNIKIWVLH